MMEVCKVYLSLISTSVPPELLFRTNVVLHVQVSRQRWARWPAALLTQDRAGDGTRHVSVTAVTTRYFLGSTTTILLFIIIAPEANVYNKFSYFMESYTLVRVANVFNIILPIMIKHKTLHIVDICDIPLFKTMWESPRCTCIYPPSHPPTLSANSYTILYYTIFLYSSPNLLIQQQPRYFCVYCSGICFLKLGLKSSTQGFTLKFEHHISFVLKMFELKTKSCRMNLLGWTHFPNTKKRTIILTLLWFGKAKYEHHNSKRSTNYYAEFEHVLRDTNTFFEIEPSCYLLLLSTL